MKKKIKYTDEPMGNGRVIKDFLPRKIKLRPNRKEIDGLFKETDAAVRKAGLKKSDVKRIIKEVRSEQREGARDKYEKF